MNRNALIGVLIALGLLGGLFVYTGGDLNQTFEDAGDIVETVEETVDTIEPVVREFEETLTDPNADTDTEPTEPTEPETPVVPVEEELSAPTATDPNAG